MVPTALSTYVRALLYLLQGLRASEITFFPGTIIHQNVFMDQFRIFILILSDQAETSPHQVVLVISKLSVLQKVSVRLVKPNFNHGRLSNWTTEQLTCQKSRKTMSDSVRKNLALNVSKRTNFCF